jgi:hypothetical protein
LAVAAAHKPAVAARPLAVAVAHKPAVAARPWAVAAAHKPAVSALRWDWEFGAAAAMLPAAALRWGRRFRRPVRMRGAVQPWLIVVRR